MIKLIKVNEDDQTSVFMVSSMAKMLHAEQLKIDPRLKDILPFRPLTFNAESDVYLITLNESTDTIKDIKVVGMCKMFKRRHNEWTLSLLYIMQNFRKKGYAYEALKEIQNIYHDSKIDLMVFEKNVNAINLYKKAGFSVITTGDEFEQYMEWE